MKRANFDPAAVPPGQKDWGYVDILDTLAIKFDMPVMVLHGQQPGPTFTVTAGLYPLEFCGVEAAARLYQQVDPAQLKGKLVIIPVVNMPVFQFRTPMFALTQSLSPMDGMDITKTFPGDPAGSATQVLAYRLFHDFILGSDYHVDLRGGELLESHLAHTIYLQGTPDLDSTLHEMGTIFGLPYCLSSRDDISHTQPGTLVYEAIARGIPSIISESGLGYNTQPSEEEVAGHVTGVLNLLKHYGMLPGTPEIAAPQHYLQPDRIRVLAPGAGIFKHVPDQGEFVREGELIGTICDLDGAILHKILAPCDAVVHEMMPRRLVYQGDRIYSLAVLAGEVEK
ncbi:MAG: succinylglutamate desuccinylase/aspartoacylase family protein [Anaerolineales bacterium]|nr:succinylglutamate desuccinylase/aspartoacylase family protein [Anaerolineales bacterium]